ncbi:MAG: class I SAM-dependent methyltransferase [Pseudomonadota bacterium]
MYEDLLPHHLPTEGERLDRMAHAHDPDTRAAISGLGLPPDATCLDIGAGRGTVAIWLAETNPGASVVAADLDLSQIVENSLSNLATKRIDVLADPLGEEVYDLIHCRALLGFLPTRNELLDRFYHALKPGGAFVATEMDFGRIAQGPSRFWAAFWTAYLEFTTAQGWDFTYGATLPRQLAQRKFSPIEAKHIQPIVNYSGETAGASEAHTWELTIATLAPRLIGDGHMPEALVRDALDIIRNPNAWTASPGFMVVTARRPVHEKAG